MLRSLQQVAIAVPDVAAGRAFYECMGLEARSRGSDVVLRCKGQDRDQLCLLPGPNRRIAWVSWGTREHELPDLQRAIAAADVPLAAPAAGADAAGLWLRDPDGILVNIRAADAPVQSRPPVEINNPGEPFHRLGRRGAPNRDIESRPRKLGHLLKFTTDVCRDVDFYTRVLGMKLSDRIGSDVVAFLRCGGDSDHHTLALAKSEAPGLHHLSWEMGTLDQIQLCAERMLAAGYKDGWGVGRHIYGSNYFHYIRDPWMGLNELFWDIDFIPESADWEVETAEAGPDSLYQWATVPPPEDFLHNYAQA